MQSLSQNPVAEFRINSHWKSVFMQMDHQKSLSSKIIFLLHRPAVHLYLLFEISIFFVTSHVCFIKYGHFLNFGTTASLSSNVHDLAWLLAIYDKWCFPYWMIGLLLKENSAWGKHWSGFCGLFPTKLRRRFPNVLLTTSVWLSDCGWQVELKFNVVPNNFHRALQKWKEFRN